MKNSTNDQPAAEIITAEEFENIVWSSLLDWLNGTDALPVEAKTIFIDRAYELRLRMQAIFVEIQRRNLNVLAEDGSYEEYMKDNLRKTFPYMNALEKIAYLKAVNTINEDRQKRLEAQLAGLDFFNTVTSSIQSLPDSKASKEITNFVKAIPSDKRQHILSLLSSIQEEMTNQEKEVNLLPESANE